ncbi:MAG: hypothetical protein WA058_03175 [Minisyncoccia bacterium]
MSVFITDDDALDRIMQVECAEMSEPHRAEFKEEHLAEGMCSFSEFKKAFGGLSADSRKCFPRACVTVRGNSAIYGADGWNRYFVRYETGEIEFSKSHSSTDSEKRALEAGFTVF